MKKVLGIILKDIAIRFSSPIEWLFFLVMPVVFMMILSGGTGMPADQRLVLPIVDLANSPISFSLIEELEKSPSVLPEITTWAKAERDFDGLKTPAVLIIPNSLTYEDVLQGKGEVELWLQKNNMDAIVARQAVQTALGRISSRGEIAQISVEEAENIKSFSSVAERDAYRVKALALIQELFDSAPTLMASFEGHTKDPIVFDARINNIAGQMITWVYIPLIGLSAMFASERAKGTLRRILITPTQKGVYIGSTILGQVGIALVQMSLLITFGTLALKVNWGHSPLALAILMISTALVGAAMGTMLGTFVKTEGQGNGISIMIGMMMAMLGGCWYPLELFPPVMQTTAKVFPTYWAMRGFLNIAIRGQGLGGALLESGVLLGFALVFFVIGVWRFKYE